MAKKIAAFGEVMMRLEVPGYALLSQSSTLNYSFSGTGVNLASALARFGHTGYVVTTLPDNPLGDAARSYLQKLGIDISLSSRGGRYIGSYFLENGFGARASRVTYTNRLESSFNTAKADRYNFRALADIVDVVAFCGITLAMNDTVRKQMKQLAAAVKQRGGIVVFDCNYRPSLWGEGGYGLAKEHYEDMLHLADIVMMNEKDALYVLGMQSEATERKEQLTELIPQVAATYRIAAIAGTQRTIHPDNTHTLLGYLYKAQSFAFSEVCKFAVYDRIGAGDAFTSGTVHGELEQWEAADTIAFATAAGMLAHTIAGDTPMSTVQDIRQAMKQSVNDVER
ncbi:sugar kinase [Paenibacillus sp. GCM10027626]|uniref:sugar kinase n=1 Tax=Paenibacillus sp. GCM10027626 TaxID=3273411 RepID=UPI003628F377